MYATYLTETPDGRTVRFLEDALTGEVGVTQTVRGAAKLAALVDPDPGRVEAAHKQVVEVARAFLASQGVAASPQAWPPPAEGTALRTPPQHGERAVYPHDLRDGQHGFRVESCAGSQVLARLRGGSDEMRYVLDLNALKGRRVMFGDYTSPETTLQGPLF